MEDNLEHYQHLNSEFPENRIYSDKLIQYHFLFDECYSKSTKEERINFDKEFTYKLKTIEMLNDSKYEFEVLKNQDLERHLKKYDKLKRLIFQIISLSLICILFNYFFEKTTILVLFVWFSFITFNFYKLILDEIEMSRNSSRISILKNTINLLERDIVKCIGGDSKVNELYRIRKKILSSEGVLQEESSLMYQIKLLQQKIYFLKESMKNRDFVDSEEFQKLFSITDVHNLYYKISNTSLHNLN